MSAEKYFTAISRILERIQATQSDQIREAARIMADSIAQDGLVHVFGSGHSVIPVLDIFPRYGSYLGFHPLLDPRLMWFTVVGPGGAPELLWLERQEGYIEVFLRGYEFRSEDVMLIFSHAGLNAAGIEVALAAKKANLPVIAVTSMENQRIASPTHSSGKKLSDVADIAIDNCVPLEDALVKLGGQQEPVAAGSTAAVVVITMVLVAEVAKILVESGRHLSVFVSPSVQGISEDHNKKVFEAYKRMLQKRDEQR